MSYKKAGKINQGYNTKSYSRLHDEFVSRKDEKIVGHLLVDEMNLKSGIWFDTNTHEVSGFVTDGDGIDLDGEIKQLLRDLGKEKSTVIDQPTESNEQKLLVTHVNQWHFRSSFNEVRNLEFFLCRYLSRK